MSRRPTHTHGLVPVPVSSFPLFKNLNTHTVYDIHKHQIALFYAQAQKQTPLQIFLIIIFSIQIKPRLSYQICQIV